MNWGYRIMPRIHALLSDKFLFFVMSHKTREGKGAGYQNSPGIKVEMQLGAL